MIQLTSHQDNDEGYRASAIKFVLEEDYVEAHMSGEGSDCDGRFDWYREMVCPIVEEDDGSYGLKLDVTGMDDWREVEGGVRDYSAEAAGY